MKKLLGITLGIMTALGGFVDLGQIVFTTQAGALFGFHLVWAILLGTVAIVVYMEMCGRVAVIAHEPVFSVVRTRLGTKLGLATLIASSLLNLLTCATELGGLAIGIHLLTGWPERLVLVGVAVLLGALMFLLRFQWIERLFGLSGLLRPSSPFRRMHFIQTGMNSSLGFRRYGTHQVRSQSGSMLT